MPTPVRQALTTTKCNRYSFRVHDYAPAQAVAFAPYLVNYMGRRWHIAYADYSWGQSTRDAYAQEIKKAGGDVVETTGIPLGTADMTPFLSKISGDFDGIFGIFFGKDGVTIGNQAYDLGLTEDEEAFYEALEVNDSAVAVLGDKALCAIARELVDAVRRNATIDWTVKESVRAKLRVMVKKILKQHGYPPDKQAQATETVLKQAELLCADWAA